MTKIAFVFATFVAGAFALSQQQAPLTPQQEQAVRARYPQSWEIEIPPGTRLAALRDQYDRRLQVFRETDVQDESPYPVWFRAYLRANLPQLPETGTYQYPRVAAQILEWMAAHPNFVVSPPADVVGQSRSFTPSRIITVGTNINVTNLDERNSESCIAVHNGEPRYLVAASNNISGSGRQRQFHSSDGGVSWTRGELPLAPGSAFHSDPALAWTTDGTAWTATLGINNLGTSIQVQVYKSTDRGASWSYVATVSDGNSNDKEMMWIDAAPASPHKDNIYLTWDVVGGGMRFARSTDLGATWSPVTSLSTDSAIGAHLASGPAGELYVAWPDTSSRQLKVRKSTDGGASFGATNVIATTNDAYELSIPAMCRRKVLIYLSIGVDRSGGPRNGWVYATWTDRDGAAADPGCGGVDSASNSNVYFSRSSDGGSSWSAPRILHSNIAKTDQFNQWMDVDPRDGTVHVAFYDTRDDSGRTQAHLYYVKSKDGGTNWVDESRISTAPTNETVAGADLGNQYGDYNGMVVFNSLAHPVWTDRRTGVPGDKEQIFTARVRGLEIFVPPDVDRCVRYPWLCRGPEMLPDALVLDCPFRGCIIVDPIPKNCLVKFDCPGCSPNALCPPFYQFFIEGLDDTWNVGIFDLFGDPAEFTRYQAGNMTVLSFRPRKDLYIERQVGDYFLAFQLGEKGKPGVPLKVKIRLKVSDEGFSPSDGGVN